MNLMVWTSLLAMAPTSQPGTQPNPTGQLIQMLGTFALFGVVLYFLMIRPQQVKAKQHTELLKALKPGDRIVTASGIVGIVVGVKDKTVSIRSADTKLEVLKSAVTDITDRSPAGSES
jgi:preprotein translocase subunit YajC